MNVPNAGAVTRWDRIKLKPHQPCVLWFTGLSGAGKSTLANHVESQLNTVGIHTALLDGDNLRQGLNKDLGFSREDRLENIRRVAEVARLMNDAGLVVLCAFISPFEAERALARQLVSDDQFIEIFVDTPLETCIARDPKGLYKRAQAGELQNFTGISQAYEAPVKPDLIVGRDGETVERASARVIDQVTRRGFIKRVRGTPAGR
jgi:bifunctional enzyme CysN/CysC